MKLINNHLEKLNSFCQMYNVDKMYLFDYPLNSSFNAKSDADFLLKFKEVELAVYFNNYIILRENLKSLFEREIDLLGQQTLKNPILINSIQNLKN